VDVARHGARNPPGLGLIEPPAAQNGSRLLSEIEMEVPTGTKRVAFDWAEVVHHHHLSGADGVNLPALSTGFTGFSAVGAPVVRLRNGQSDPVAYEFRQDGVGVVPLAPATTVRLVRGQPHTATAFTDAGQRLVGNVDVRVVAPRIVIIVATLAGPDEHCQQHEP